MQNENRVLTSNYPEDWKRYSLVNVVYKHEKLSKEELEKIMYELREKLTVPFNFLLVRFFRTLRETGKLLTAFLALRHSFFYRQTYMKRYKLIKKSQNVI